MNFIVVGLNHKSAPIEVRERAAVPAEEKPQLCSALVQHQWVDEAAVLSTCNRTELYLSSFDLDAAAQLGRTTLAQRCALPTAEVSKSLLYEARRFDAARHLFEVTASLDSLVVGEPHIVGQVRDDFERAQNAGSIGKLLGRLFVKALELGKAVRGSTEIGDSPVSVSSIALDLAERVFGSLAERTVLVLGAGEMGRQTAILAEYRQAGKIIVSSRTLAHAAELANRVNGQTTPFDQREQAMITADIIITSTGAVSPIIDYDQMSRVMQQRRNRPVFIIDIAVPRDVDPQVDELYNLYRYDLDDLAEIARENEIRRQSAIPVVQNMISDALTDFENWCKERKVVPTIVRLRERAETIRRELVDAHLRRMPSLDERDRHLVEALSLAIVNKVLHEPTVRLKDAAAQGTDAKLVQAVEYLFDLPKSDIRSLGGRDGKD